MEEVTLDLHELQFNRTGLPLYRRAMRVPNNGFPGDK